jgi:hypothetical protein
MIRTIYVMVIFYVPSLTLFNNVNVTMPLQDI